MPFSGCGVPGGQVLLSHLVQVGELGVPIGVLAALGGLGVALQAVPQLAQQPPDHEIADPVPVLGQRGPARGSTSTSTATATSGPPGTPARSTPPTPPPDPGRASQPACDPHRDGVSAPRSRHPAAWPHSPPAHRVRGHPHPRSHHRDTPQTPARRPPPPTTTVET